MISYMSANFETLSLRHDVSYQIVLESVAARKLQLKLQDCRPHALVNKQIR